MGSLLAIDQSITCTAWVIFEGDQYDMTSFGCIKTKKDTSRNNLYRRSSEICGVLRHLSTQVDTLVREGLGFGLSNSNASRDLAYLVGAIERDCGPFFEVAPTQLKKFSTGSGKADKQDMIEALPEYILTQFMDAGYKKSTGLSDLADAYFIGKWFASKDELEHKVDSICKDKKLKNILIKDFDFTEEQVSNDSKRRGAVRELIEAGRIV